MYSNYHRMYIAVLFLRQTLKWYRSRWARKWLYWRSVLPQITFWRFWLRQYQVQLDRLKQGSHRPQQPFQSCLLSPFLFLLCFPNLGLAGFQVQLEVIPGQILMLFGILWFLHSRLLSNIGSPVCQFHLCSAKYISNVLISLECFQGKVKIFSIWFT